MRLSKQALEMLRHLEKGPYYRGHWDFSGMRLPAKLRREGFITVCDHPTVKERDGYPAGAYCLTDAGREALRDRP